MTNTAVLEEATFNVFGLDISVRTPDTRFLGFVAANYRAFTADTHGKSRICVTFSTESGKKARAAKHTLNCVGQGTWADQSRLYFENEFGFACLLDVHDPKHWKLHGYHFDLERDQSIEETYQNYQRSMRWLIHFPLFILLEKEQGKSLLHASAVSKAGSAVIFFGPNKAGKSGLCLSLVQEHGYDLMTDNFLLYDERAVYGFPERSRVSPESLKYLQVPWPISDYLVYEKHHMDVDLSKLSLQSRPRAFFFTRFGEKLKIKSARRNMLKERIQTTHDELREFPNYSFYVHLSKLGIQTAPSRLDLFDETSLYDLVHPKNWTTAKTVDEVISHVD